YAEDGPFTIADSIANWRDVLGAATSPVDGATDVQVTSDITVSFNKTVNPASEFEVLDGESEPVPGAFSVDNGTSPTITFNPAADLCIGETYTVNVSGVGADGDGIQYHDYSFDFKTPANITFNVTVPGTT